MKIFRLMIHYPSEHNGRCYADQKPGASSRSPTRVQGPKALGRPGLLSRALLSPNKMTLLAHQMAITVPFSALFIECVFPTVHIQNRQNPVSKILPPTTY